MAAERILVVDDEPGVRAALEAILADEGFEVRSAESGERGLEALEREAFDAVLLDVWLPGMDGLDTLRQLREGNHDPEVVMISGHGTIETAVRATKLGAFDFVEKPLSLDKTLLVLRNALRQRRLERSNRHLLEQVTRDTEIVGTSRAADGLRAAVRVAAGTDAPVLLCGEPGSGRETVARRIHALGRRPDAPFVELPCGALGDAAAERALYGHGGAPGRIELARGGTLFLEDAERLGPAVQRRVAATLDVRKTDPTLPRPLASTGTDGGGLEVELRQAVDVVRIDVPSLRERREDVPVLAERFLRDMSREYGRAPKPLSPEVVSALKAHTWPGNVRELGNLIERLLLFAPGPRVELRDLPESLGGSERPSEDLYRDFTTLDAGVAAFRRFHAARALMQENGDEVAAARRLGIEVPALREALSGGTV